MNKKKFLLQEIVFIVTIVIIIMGLKECAAIIIDLSLNDTVVQEIIMDHLIKKCETGCCESSPVKDGIVKSPFEKKEGQVKSETEIQKKTNKFIIVGTVVPILILVIIKIVTGI